MCLHDSGSNYILAFLTQPSAISRRLAMSQSHGVNTSGVSQPIETRRAEDGEWWTHAQFKDHYGDLAYWHWVSAEQQTAPDGCGPPLPPVPPPPSTTPPAVSLLPPVPPPPSTTPPAGSGASDVHTLLVTPGHNKHCRRRPRVMPATVHTLLVPTDHYKHFSPWRSSATAHQCKVWLEKQPA